MRSLLVLLALAAPALADDGTVIDGDLGKRLDRVAQVKTGGGFWGTILVARKGKVVLAKGYGFADYGSRPNTPKTLHEIASASKQFTGAAIVKLVQQGKLRLEDTIGKLFPAVPKDKHAITVHQLLTHTSGISPNVGIPYGSPLNRAAAVRRFLLEPLASAPGKRWAYSNAAYSILAAIVEVASGRSFEEYSRAELFTPAGMKDTGFVRSPWLDAKRASTRLSDRMPGTAVKWFWSWGYRGMGGVVTTALDLLKWHQALQGTAVLDAVHKKLLFTPIRRSYACGWFIQTTPRGTIKHHHSGGVAGYGSMLTRFPTEDVVIAVLSNGKSDLMGVAKALEETLFPPPRVELAVDVSPYKLSKWKAAELKTRAAWTVERTKTGLVLALVETATKHRAAVVTIPRGLGRKLRDDLRRAFRGKPLPKRGDAAETESGLYLNAYRLAKGKLRLDRKLTLRVLPRYVGMGEGGKRIVDERITLVVSDPRRWPVMTKLNQAAAKALIEALNPAVR